MTAHPELPTLEADIKNPAFVEEGKGLFESVGCKGCHAIDPDSYGSPVGVAEGFKPNEARTTKDFAPNLDKIAEKTSARVGLHVAEKSARLLTAYRDAVAAA